MEEKVYNVLWLDDQHADMIALKGRFKEKGIILKGYKSLEAGMDELERKQLFYDAVLLDAMFFENESNEEGDEETANSYLAFNQINSLEKKFPVFVLTGQPEVQKDRTYKQVFKRVYPKGIPNVVDQLIIDIKEAADQHPDTQLKHQHRKVFDACTAKYLGNDVAIDVLELLKRVNGPFDTKDLFNKIRQVIEPLFRAFNRFELLPSEFVQSSVALNGSYRFLCGEEVMGYKPRPGASLPEPIVSCLKQILFVTQDGSHVGVIKNHVAELSTPYLYQGVLFLLLDVLAWFKTYIDSNPAKNRWERTWAGELGTVQISNSSNRAVFKPETSSEDAFILPHLVSSYHLTNGMRIIAELVSNDRPYPSKKVKRLQIIT